MKFRPLLPLLALALVALAPLAAFAQSIFADKALETVVRQYVFAKKNNQEPLTADDVKNISTISGKKQKIANLAGLEHCKALQLIDLEENEIADLAPIKELKMLQSVN